MDNVSILLPFGLPLCKKRRGCSWSPPGGLAQSKLHHLTPLTKEVNEVKDISKRVDQHWRLQPWHDDIISRNEESLPPRWRWRRVLPGPKHPATSASLSHRQSRWLTFVDWKLPSYHTNSIKMGKVNNYLLRSYKNVCCCGESLETTYYYYYYIVVVCLTS